MTLPAPRIGIFGGSFNPIHLGHTGLALALHQCGLVDEVWFLVSPLNPWKQGTAATLAPTAHRLEMARIATADHADIIRVSDFESTLPIPSYTADTLDALRLAYPHAHFHLIIGEDNWTKFSQWRRHDDIRRQFPIIVYGRSSKPGSHQAHVCLHRPDGTSFIPHKPSTTPHSTSVHIGSTSVQSGSTFSQAASPSSDAGSKAFQLFPISSTEIRQALSRPAETLTDADRKALSFLHPGVADYIRQHHLYVAETPPKPQN